MGKWKVISLSLFVALFGLMGCMGKSATMTHTSASWAYPFVRVNGISYGVSTNEINKDDVGGKIGRVKRNVEAMDAGPEKYVEHDFDSNELNEGTPLFWDLKDPNSICYEKKGKFFLATKID
ncbi:MAG TPA: hypothetical protein VLK78_07555 [Candidatus Angelobacter sp.]|nr:hypothetical protein [Candidatus Angelobacter sp.]